MVVTKQSATLPGYPTVGIHSHHADMVKFSSADDPGFEAVCRELRWWIPNIMVDAVGKNDGRSSEKNKAADTEGPLIEPAGSGETCEKHLKSNPDAS